MIIFLLKKKMYKMHKKWERKGRKKKMIIDVIAL